MLFNGELVLILGGLKSEILLYLQSMFLSSGREGNENPFFNI